MAQNAKKQRLPFAAIAVILMVASLATYVRHLEHKRIASELQQTMVVYD